MDVDLNSKNIYEQDNSTIAFFSLHYDGHIVETGDASLAKRIENQGFTGANAMTEDEKHE